MKTIGLILSLAISAAAFANDGGGTVGSDKVANRIAELMSRDVEMGKTEYVGSPLFSLDRTAYAECLQIPYPPPRSAEEVKAIIEDANYYESLHKRHNNGKPVRTLKAATQLSCKYMSEMVTPVDKNSDVMIFTAEKMPNYYFKCSRNFNSAASTKDIKVMICTNVSKTDSYGGGDHFVFEFKTQELEAPSVK